MQKLQRQAGKLMKRSADKADVSTVMQEFKVADQLLDAYMDAVRSFQNAWNQILAFQSGTAQQMETVFRPIHDSESKFNADPDARTLERTTKLRQRYVDLSKDLKQETDYIQSKLLQPAMDAKTGIAPLKKAIKQRENYKLDYERYQSRYDHSKSKVKTIKDETALTRLEADLSSVTMLYERADEQIVKTFPPVIDAIQALVPLLLNEQIMLQHSLVGQLYTVLHEYCTEFGFPSPAPPMDDVVSTWDQHFSPLRKEAESALEILSGGKAVNQPFHPPAEKPTSSTTGLSIRSRFTKAKPSSPRSATPIRRISSGATEDGEDDLPSRPPRSGPLSPSIRPRITSTMSMQSIHSHQALPEDEEIPPPKPPRSGPSLDLATKPRTPSMSNTPRVISGTPLAGMSPVTTPGATLREESRRGSTASSQFYTPIDSSRPGISPQQGDYFANQRSVSTSSVASSIASKKKPPPPPVKRRITGNDLYVVAMYDFTGQGDGDLSFREGDQIKVIKKSESTDDWWLGSLRGGPAGSFPANYVQVP